MACKDSKNCPPKKNQSTKKKIASREFVLHAPEASEILLTVDFNDWNATQYTMRKFKNSDYTKKLKLMPGRYEY